MIVMANITCFKLYNKMTHTINSFQFEFTCPDEDQAFNLRHNFTITLQDKIVEVTDKICSKYIKEDELLIFKNFRGIFKDYIINR